MRARTREQRQLEMNPYDPLDLASCEVTPADPADRYRQAQFALDV